MFCDDDFAPEATKGVAPVATQELWIAEEPVSRGVAVAFGSVEVAVPDCGVGRVSADLGAARGVVPAPVSKPLGMGASSSSSAGASAGVPPSEFVSQGRAVSFPVEPVAAVPPPVPSAPFFLEKTHVPSTAPADQLYAGVKRMLAAQPGASLSANDSKFKLEFQAVREYVGIEAVVRLYTQRSSTLVEFQCMLPRARVQFLSLYREVVEGLAAEGLVSVDAIASLPHVPRSQPLPLPTSLLPKLDLSVDALFPLHAMVQSPSFSSQREGLSVLASLVCAASPSAAAGMVKAGTLAILQDAAKTAESHFETRANCLAAISTLQTV